MSGSALTTLSPSHAHAQSAVGGGVLRAEVDVQRPRGDVFAGDALVVDERIWHGFPHSLSGAKSSFLARVGKPGA